jgi:hypothetical protein
VKHDITIGAKYFPALQVKTAEEARAYFEQCVAHTMEFGKSREDAEQIERHNIGYFMGYEKREEMARLTKLYGFGHPFISLDDTPEQILRKGLEMGRKTAEK